MDNLQPTSPPVRWTLELLSAVLAKRRRGMLQRQLASEYGVSITRIAQVIAKAERAERAASHAQE